MSYTGCTLWGLYHGVDSRFRLPGVPTRGEREGELGRSARLQRFLLASKVRGLAGAEQPGANAGEGVGNVSSLNHSSKWRVWLGSRKRSWIAESYSGEGADTNYSRNSLFQRRVWLEKGGGSLNRLFK